MENKKMKKEKETLREKKKWICPHGNCKVVYDFNQKKRIIKHIEKHEDETKK